MIQQCPSCVYEHKHTSTINLQCGCISLERLAAVTHTWSNLCESICSSPLCVSDFSPNLNSGT